MQKLPADLIGRVSVLGPAYELFLGLWLEKFHRHTIDSFRVKHNNVRLSLLELANYLERPRIHPEEIKDLCAEIADLMKSDLVLPELVSNYQQFVPLFQSPLIAKEVNPGLRLVAEQLVDALRDTYRVRLVEMTIDALRASDISSTIRLTEALATEALHQGFSRNRLQQLGLEIISRAKKHSVGVPEDAFIHLLESLRHPPISRYEVCYKIFVNDLKTKESLLALPPEIGIQEHTEAKGAEEWENASGNSPAVFTSIAIDSFDAVAAGVASLPQLMETLALLQVCSMGSRLVLHEQGLILSPGRKPAHPFETHLEILGPLALHKEDIVARFKDVGYINRRSDLKQNTQERLRVSLRTFRNGLAAKTPQEQYLLFWIGLETLVTGGEYKTATEIRDFVAVAQAIDYPRKLLRDFLENLVRCEAHVKLTLWPQLVEYPEKRKSSAGINEACGHLWNALMDPAECARISAALNAPGYHLLNQRLHHLVGKLGQVRNVLDALEDTQRRVSLHVQRLYRVRNAIVHGGYVPNDLSQLSSHLLSYFWEVLRLVLAELAGRNAIKSIEDVFEKARFTFKQLIEHLSPRKGTGLDLNDFTLLLDPHVNCWPS